MAADWTGREVQALRLAMRMTVAELAAKLSINERTVKRWLAGGRISDVNQASLDTLLSRQSAETADAYRRRLCPDARDDEMDRRALLRTAGGAGVGLAAVGLVPDEQRARWLMSGAGRTDRHALDLVRSTLHGAMLLDDTLGSPAAQGMVVAQQQLVEAMLTNCPANLRPDALTLYAEWVGLAGVLAFDANDFRTAARLYNLARDTAHEADSEDVGGYMLAHMSQLALWQQQPRVAVDHAVAAQARVTRSRDRSLRAYISMRAAEAYAVAGQRGYCLDALDDAAGALAGYPAPGGPAESRAYFATPAMLSSFRAQCCALLGDWSDALTASRAALDSLDPRFSRDRAMVMLELAGILVRTGEVEEATAMIGDAVTLTDRNRSPRLAAFITTSRRTLSPWSATPAVRQLDDQLEAHAIVRA